MRFTKIAFYIEEGNLCAKAVESEPVNMDKNDPLRQWTKAALVYAGAIANDDALVPCMPLASQMTMEASLTLMELSDEDVLDYWEEGAFEPEEGDWLVNDSFDPETITKAMNEYECGAFVLRLEIPDYEKIGFRSAPAVRLAELTTRAVMTLMNRKQASNQA